MPVHTLATAVVAEIEIRKSRFIGYAMPVPDRDAAMAELVRLRAGHAGATHVCWAVLAGGQAGMSDDGEPSGTAGRPIMEVLRHHELDGVLGVVVRYYGGIKLGAGGLVRAYTEAVATALLQARRIERVTCTEISVRVSYPDEARVRRWLDQQGYTLSAHAYGAEVTLTFALPEPDADAAWAALRDLTHGRIERPASAS